MAVKEKCKLNLIDKWYYEKWIDRLGKIFPKHISDKELLFRIY